MKTLNNRDLVRRAQIAKLNAGYEKKIEDEKNKSAEKCTDEMTRLMLKAEDLARVKPVGPGITRATVMGAVIMNMFSR